MVLISMYCVYWACKNDFLKLAADDVFEENYRLWIYYKTVINKTDKEILN